MEEKNSMFILAIVGMVAIVGIIMSVMTANNIVSVTGADEVGMAAKSKIIAVVEPICGDGIINGGEQCDGNNLGGITCTDIGSYTGGTLSCYPPGSSQQCTFDTSNCDVGYGYCGDGNIDPGEQCDGYNLNGMTCEDLGFVGGNLYCDECLFNTGACYNSSASITQHDLYVYGQRSYMLDTMEYHDTMGIYAYMQTSNPAQASLDAYCYNWNYNTPIRLSTYAYGMTDPYLATGGSTSGGVNYEQLTANCNSWANIWDGPSSSTEKTFNTNSATYPVLNGGAIYKNTLTNQYFVYFDASNQEGGICKLWYNVDWFDGNDWQYTHWEYTPPTCLPSVSYLAPVNITSNDTLQGIGLYIGLQPYANDDSMLTTGSGWYTFNAYAPTVYIEGQKLVPFTVQKATGAKKAELEHKMTGYVEKQIAAETVN